MTIRSGGEGRDDRKINADGTTDFQVFLVLFKVDRITSHIIVQWLGT